MTKSIPPVQEVMEEIIVDADEATYAIIRQGYFADAMPSIPEMGYLWSPMASAMTSLWVNDKSPEKVLKRAESVIKEQISLQE